MAWYLFVGRHNDDVSEPSTRIRNVPEWEIMMEVLTTVSKSIYFSHPSWEISHLEWEISHSFFVCTR
jgi:hypothetical protein